MGKKIKYSNDIDVLLLLEGTYPYVRGGVSSWIHQIISGMPNIRFGIIFLGGSPDHYGDIQYEMPDNIVFLKLYYLESSWTEGQPKEVVGNSDAYDQSDQLHAAFKQHHCPVPDELLSDVLNLLGKEEGLSHQSFLYSQRAWDSITESYEQHSREPSFLNYFWTVRSMHAPLFTLAKAAAEAPDAPVIHSISTGYAGFLGALIKRRKPNTHYLLSEHGIYTKERKIDLAQATWITEGDAAKHSGLVKDTGYLRSMWIRFFEVIGRVTYQSSNQIFSLYEGNRQRQIIDGASENRTRVIPNGISLARYEDALTKRPEGIPPIIGLIGRVVPIKDIKTFIRTLHAVREEIPEVEGWIVGPEEENPEYAKECYELVENLALENTVKFLGFQNVPDILPQLGVMTLTSISEAQPLVILEAYAAGVPCVCTDVGSCSELIYGGLGPEDVALGAAGSIVDIADPAATAQACIRLLTDAEQWRKAQNSGLQRVMRFYREDLMYERYETLYKEAVAESWKEPEAVLEAI